MYLLRMIQWHAYQKADYWPKHRLDYGEMILTESLCGLQDAARHFVPGSLSYPSGVTFLKHRTIRSVFQSFCICSDTFCIIRDLPLSF